MKKQIGGMIVIYLVGAIVAFLLIVGILALPNDLIKRHVAESADTIMNEGTYPAFMEDKLVRMHPDDALDLKTLLLNNRITARDNFTDAIDFPLSSMDAYVKGDTDELQRMSFDRYWHGYMVFLRPLLLLLNLTQIRILNLIIMVALLLTICKLTGEKVSKVYSGWFLYGLLFFMPFTVAFRMQFCTSTYVMLIVLIILLKDYEWL